MDDTFICYGHFVKDGARCTLCPDKTSCEIHTHLQRIEKENENEGKPNTDKRC